MIYTDYQIHMLTFSYTLKCINPQCYIHHWREYVSVCMPNVAFDRAWNSYLHHHYFESDFQCGIYVGAISVYWASAHII